MNTIKFKILSLCLGTALLSSCAGGYSNEGLGTGLGADSGAMIGTSISNNEADSIISPEKGAMMGYEVGRQTDDHYRYEGYRYDTRYNDRDGYRYGY